MKVEIFGDKISCEHDFHMQLAQALGVQRHYGYNLDALWDLLSMGVERPLSLIWLNSERSKAILGNDFERIVAVLERVRLQDEYYEWEEKFVYEIN